MSNQIVRGATVRGPFTVIRAASSTKEVLVDKHMVVLDISQDGAHALCMYTGSFDRNNGHQNLPGFVEVSQSHNDLAGWRLSNRFYADACQLCIVPASLLEVEGRVSNGFFKVLTDRVLSLKDRVKTSTHSAEAVQRVTGVARRLKNGERIC